MNDEIGSSKSEEDKKEPSVLQPKRPWGIYLVAAWLSIGIGGFGASIIDSVLPEPVMVHKIISAAIVFFVIVLIVRIIQLHIIEIKISIILFSLLALYHLIGAVGFHMPDQKIDSRVGYVISLIPHITCIWYLTRKGFREMSQEFVAYKKQGANICLISESDFSDNKEKAEKPFLVWVIFILSCSSPFLIINQLLMISGILPSSEKIQNYYENIGILQHVFTVFSHLYCFYCGLMLFRLKLIAFKLYIGSVALFVCSTIYFYIIPTPQMPETNQSPAVYTFINAALTLAIMFYVYRLKKDGVLRH